MAKNLKHILQLGVRRKICYSCKVITSHLNSKGKNLLHLNLHHLLRWS